MNNMNFFSEYKPFRNYLRKFEVIESLCVLNSYVEYFQRGKKFPRDTGISGLSSKIGERPHEFYLEKIGVELIINGSSSSGKKTLRSWNDFAEVNNKLRTLENFIAGASVGKSNILLEIYRIAHRQFIWQQYKPDDVIIARYYKIFKHKALELIIQRVFSMDAKTYMLHGIWMFSGFIKNCLISRIEKSNGLSKEHLDTLLDHYSKGLPELVTILTNEQKIDENYAYNYHSLKAYPIIRTEFRGENVLACPFTNLLVWRMTSGIFYEINKETGFSTAWGNAFQNYVGEVSKKSNFTVLPEQEYIVKKGKREDTTDWIIHDGDTVLFIECKARRPTIDVKSVLDEDVVKRDLKAMALAIVQVYKNIHDYLGGYYEIGSENKKELDMYPIIVTLEEWYIFNPSIVKMINESLIAELDKEDIPRDYINKMPWSIVSIHDFEYLTQIINSVGIKAVFQKRFSSKEFPEQIMGVFLKNQFQKQYLEAEALFKNDFDEIFSGFV